jgi:hypothetical protein
LPADWRAKIVDNPNRLHPVSLSPLGLAFE